MIPSSGCLQWPPDQPGSCRQSWAPHHARYTTPRGTIDATVIGALEQPPRAMLGYQHNRRKTHATTPTLSRLKTVQSSANAGEGEQGLEIRVVSIRQHKLQRTRFQTVLGPRAIEPIAQQRQIRCYAMCAWVSGTMPTTVAP